MERRILIIDDDRSMCEVLEVELGRRDYDVTTVNSPQDGLARFEHDDFGVVVTDMNMSGMSGVDLCKLLVARREDMPVIVITAYANVETAIAAIRAGAYDFVTKPFDMDELALTIERALHHRALREEVKRLREAQESTQRFEDILGTNPAMLKMCELVTRVADTETTVLVTGAFTDARTARPGLFVKATGGTILLDEIGEMPAGMQAKLLRALQERTARPVGGDQEIPFDARIIAATNRDLETEVEEKRFREDLFYRINVVRTHVPPLRARGSDILLLAQHFLERYAIQSRRAVLGMTSAAADKLLTYPWPGNVRELQNCIQRAVALAQFDQIGVDDLPERIGAYKPSRIAVVDGTDPSTFLPMDEVERRYVGQVVDALGGNKASAARVLGMDRRTLYRKLERWAGAPESTG